MEESQRLINPLGFTVTSWRTGPHFGGYAMKKLTVKVIAASLIALSAFSVSALEKPVSSSLDKRVLYTEHKEGQAYPINAVNGVITAIVLPTVKSA